MLLAVPSGEVSAAPVFCIVHQSGHVCMIPCALLGTKHTVGLGRRVRESHSEGSQLFVDDNGQAVLVEQYDSEPEYKVLEARAKEWIESQPS